jgi:hypothetical protein
MANSFVGGPMLVNVKKNFSGSWAPGPRGEEVRQEIEREYASRSERLHEAALVRKLVLLRESLRAMHMEHQVAMDNVAIQQGNARTFEVLEATTGEKLPRSAATWWEWWQDYNEVYREPKPTCTYQAGRVDPYYVPWVTITRHSCFPAGTPVRTETGLVSIEQIQVGDRVLAQDPETGELAYKVVLQTTERPPSELLKIKLGDTTITTTKGHPFWVNKLGWRMAKHLEGGQQLHGIRGGHRIDRSEPAGTDTAYNLVVADFSTYFVGESGILAHDNTYRKPTTALTPGLLARHDATVSP